MTATHLPFFSHPALAPVPPWLRGWGLCAGLALAAGLPSTGRAADPAPAAPATQSTPASSPVAAASAAKNIGAQVREAVQSGASANQRITLVVNGKEKKYITLPVPPAIMPAQVPAKTQASTVSRPGAAAARPLAPMPAVAVVNPQASRRYIQARAAALSAPGAASTSAAPEGGADWRYEGVNGPQAWGQLRPDFHLCASGKRQSPIPIDESSTLQGPAEPLQFNYQPSGASVFNNGRTILVDVVGDNRLSVRGSSFQLQQISFHHPSEQRINKQGFAMAAHLLHKNGAGQLAVLVVLLHSGAANALINKVWTYLPLDAGDRVPMPQGLLDLNELLPQDQRYYQFMGSLSTPPCTEGVLWLVLKQPTAVSPQQIKLFGQLFANNARPLQPLHGRAVRDAQ